jgi:hypothetical protein
MQSSGNYAVSVSGGLAGALAESIDARAARIAEEREVLAGALANEIAETEARLHQLREMRAQVMAPLADSKSDTGPVTIRRY